MSTVRKLARPFQDVLEDVAMDRFEMRSIEPAGQWGLEQLGEASMCIASFECCELLRISETAQVFEDGCAGVQIRIRTLRC
jgi:hypothetical protein